MKEIIIYGRGGQGAVTVAQLLATAAFLEGYWAQTFPRFGAERRGAPVIAYIRIDKEPIAIRSKVYAPDVVVVMDFNLFKMIKPLDNLKAGGTAIINFPAGDRQLPDQIKKKSRSYLYYRCLDDRSSDLWQNRHSNYQYHSYGRLLCCDEKCLQ